MREGKEDNSSVEMVFGILHVLLAGMECVVGYVNVFSAVTNETIFSPTI